LPIADCRSPIADCRSPIAQSRSSNFRAARSSLKPLDAAALVAADAEVFTMAAAALHRIGAHLNPVEEAEITVVHARLDRVAALMTVDALGLAMTGLALSGIHPRHARVHLHPCHIVIRGTQWFKVVVTCGARFGRLGNPLLAGSMAVMADGARRVLGAVGKLPCELFVSYVEQDIEAVAIHARDRCSFEDVRMNLVTELATGLGCDGLSGRAGAELEIPVLRHVLAARAD
jgi:hypothetical protein